MEFLADYALFILKAFTVIVMIFILPLLCLAAKSSGKDKKEGELSIKNINKQFDEMEKSLIKARTKSVP